MKVSRLSEALRIPVSHDPALIKDVILDVGAVPGLRNFSHITFPPGSVVAEHSHKDGTEVFYCLAGRAEVSVQGATVEFTPGTCLAVEPGEVHALGGMEQGMEMLFFYVFT